MSVLSILLCAQISLFGARLHRGEAPPPLRAARHVLLLHRDVERVDPSVTRTREEALALAASIARRARDGEHFAALARELSEAPTSASGGVLGSYVSGVLEPQLDAFLFGAELGEVSDPIDVKSGVHVLQRIEVHAGVLQIFFSGADEAARARAERVAAELAAGGDFAALAREHSEERLSRERGGQYAVFERGASDKLIKAAVFDADVGEVIGPLPSPLGWHLLRRVPPETIDRDLWEQRFVRLRALVLAHEESQGLDPFPGRTREAAVELARELRARIEAGADMAEIARELDDDPGGRERAGDLGWMHRATPGLPAWLTRAWLEPVGWLSDVISTPAGFVILRRER